MIQNLKKKAIRDTQLKRDGRKFFFFSGMLVLLIIALTLKHCLGPAYQKHTAYIPTENNKDSSFNWANAVINYTPHAQCRMECRHITKPEVFDILHNGKVNIVKSQLDAPECQRRYALDGYSKENQHLRIIAAPCGDKLTIITCIDLDHDWPCECGKDY